MPKRSCATNKSTRNKQQRASRTLNWRFINRVSILGLLISLFAWGYLQLSDPEVFPVNKVTIVGEFEKLDKVALKQAVMPSVVKGFFSLSVKTVKQDVEQLPWVKDTVIHRRWPDEIIVDITQHQAAGIWNGKAVITKSKEIFFPDKSTIPNGLPKLYGPDGLYKEVQNGYIEMSSILGTIGLTISEISMDRRHSWHVQLDNKIHLVLGQKDYQLALKNFVDSYQQIIENHVSEIRYVDLRYGSGMAVHWA